MKKAIIVDLDQTICESTEILQEFILGDKKDWNGYYSNLHRCIPKHDILKELTSFARNNKIDKVLFVTSRSEISFDITCDWLKKYYCDDFGICDCSELFMRKIDDFRPSAEVKRDVYLNSIKSDYKVLKVYDDDLSVIEMFKNEGLETRLVKVAVQYVD